MSDDLVRRLRRYKMTAITLEAANRIERLEEVLDMLLVEAEDVFVCMADATGIDRHHYPATFIIARNALADGKEK